MDKIAFYELGGGPTVVRKVSFGEKIQYLPGGWIFFTEILTKGLT
jgi:hypothetical protein